MAEPRRPDVFARAQMRLALLFAGLVILLVLVSSLFTYLSFSSDIRSAAGHSFPSDDDERAYVAQSLGALRWQLLAIDAGIVVALGVGGLLYARRTLRPIRDNVAAQKRFIADASHELRTPLAVMKADFEVALRDPSLASASRPVLESGLEEVDAMSALVQDLLTLSRIDAHQEQLAGETLDLDALVRQTTEKLRGLAAAAGVELALHPRGLQVPAGGDEPHVRRALANVVKNAIEHAPPGSAVEIQARHLAGTAQISVTDHGAGMPPEVQAHVFDRFYRADPSRSRATGGSGLGLAIAQWALRAMGGDIVVQSAVGAGTRVTLSLPMPRT
jgi:signal transduction histidine kinase